MNNLMLQIFNVLDFGAVADGRTDDAAAIQRAVDAAHAAGGGRVAIPAGATVRAGSFQLRSNIDFHVAAGATLLSATGIEAFPHRVFEFGPEAEKRYWIGAKHAENITLSGGGVIDGQCRAFALEENEHAITKTYRWRPATTCFEDVRGVQVRDLTFRDAANWTLHFVGCEDIDVHDVRILNDLKFPNADGIDPDHCRRVRIARCHIVAADDCIVLKNTEPYAKYGPCEDIEITDCRLESVSSAFKIGSESVDAFRRVRMSNCGIERSNRGLAIQLRDGGSVEDVEFNNITVETRRFAPGWWGSAEAIYVTALGRNARTTVGTVRNVRFNRIRCRGENGVVIYAEPAGRVDGIHFDDVSVEIARHTPWASGLFDVRPCPEGYLPPESAPVGEDTPWGRPATRACAAVSVDGALNVNAEAIRCTLPEGDTVKWTGLRRR
ncbi:MAG: glycoside hydrolase family 28 protein [Opitutaceae bacterium]|nr:glycoside hydrolase family 28 protein [Opitutaceae bacterium]